MALRILRVRPDMMVIGTDSIYAMGDCAWLSPPKLEDKADELFNRATSNHFPEGAGITWLRHNATELLACGHAQLYLNQCDYNALEERDNLKLEEFKKLLATIDAGYKPPIQTAQMARQAGAYLGCAFNKTPDSNVRTPIVN